MSFQKRYAYDASHSSDYLREVLEDDSGRLEGDLDVLGSVFNPLEDLLDVGGQYVKLIAISYG